MNQKGFTLIELVVVMAMIGILAITSMVGYDRFIQRAEETKAAELIKNIQKGDAIDISLKHLLSRQLIDQTTFEQFQLEL